MKIDPIIFLPIIAVLAIASAAEAAWRLWKKRPGRYGSIPIEVLSAVLLSLATFMLFPGGTLVSTVAKVAACLGFIGAAVLRLVARQRLAVQI